MTPPIHLHVTPSDDAPIYRQVVRQVIEGVASGALTPGEQLPSLRALAQKLVVAPLTVKKAYDVLEADGVIETRRGKGTFVSANAARSEQEASERLRPIVRRLVVEAEVAGMDAGVLAALIEQETDALRRERERRGELS
jgi:GntR family transcriptional regulator